MEMKICSRGVWDSTIPGIEFDEEGISNYARLQDILMEYYPRGEKGRQEWDRILTDIKRKGRGKKYDCVIGVSGGTDSSYLLYLAKEIYHLKPLAVNLDNGWNSDISVQNIKKITSALHVDLETYVINYEEIKDLLRSYIRAIFPWIDVPTDIAIKAAMYLVARREGIKYILRGNDFRSEGKQPREWTYGDHKQLSYIHRRFGEIKKLKTFPSLPFHRIIFSSIILGIKEIKPYYYLDYDKQSASKFLEKEFKWKYYGGHHYENIFTRFAISYWLAGKFGIDKRKITLSAQILSGAITREAALAELKNPPYTVNDAIMYVDYVLKKLEISEEEFDRLWKNENKSFLDYPSNFRLVENSLKYLSPGLKFIFPAKPMAFMEIEIRKDQKRKKSLHG